MSLGHSLTSPLLKPVGFSVPWQFRVRPALFLTVSSILAIFVMVGSLVLLRRLSGDLKAELSPGVMLIMALATATTLVFARIAWRRSFPLETPADLSLADRVIGWSSSAALAFLAVGCCYPANRTADWLIWLPLLVADQFWRQNFFDAGEPWDPSNEEQANIFSSSSSPTLSIADSPRHENPKHENPSHENIVQQLYRLRDEQGLEIIYGTLRADFVAGQRTAIVHLGFCPPLTYLPEIEAEALPGFLAKIKVVQALAHGTRLDIRLPVPASTDCQVWIDMAARPVGTLVEAKTA